MGGADCYCALCGCPTGYVTADDYVYEDFDDESGDESGDESDKPSPCNLTDQQLEWLNEVRLFEWTDTADDSGFSKVSGLARHDDLNFFNLTGADGRDYHRVAYSADRCLPVHEKCFYQVLLPSIKILSRHSKYAKQFADNLDQDLLWEVMFSFVPVDDEYARTLDLDYGVVKEFQEQYWSPNPGSEDWVIDPGPNLQLQTYSKRLPKLSKLSKDDDNMAVRAGSSKSGVTHIAVGKVDPLASLPVEIMINILDSLSFDDVRSLQSVSRNVAYILNSNRWWFQRVVMDQIWAFELEESLSNFNAYCDVDWRQVYHDLVLLSSHEEKDQKLSGIANRARIFLVCREITELYLHRLLQKPGTQDIEIAKVTVASVQEVSRFERKDAELLFAIAAPSWAAVATSDLNLTIEYNGQGIIKALAFDRANPKRSHGRKDQKNAELSLKLAASDWIETIVLHLKSLDDANSEADIGHGICGLTLLTTLGQQVDVGTLTSRKQILSLQVNHVFIGLSFEVVRDAICKVSMLQGNPSRDNSVEIKEQKRLGSYVVREQSIWPKRVTNHVWIGELPPRLCKLSELKSGYWVDSAMLRTEPLEFLLLGINEQQLAKIEAIIMDGLLCGMGVRLTDGTVRSIGSRIYGQVEFLIDGPGGERINQMYVHSGPLPSCVRLITNRGRQFIFGDAPRPNDEGSLMVGNGQTLAGFYAGWAYGSGESTPQTMHAIGAIMQEAIQNPEVTLIPSDSEGHLWTTSAPPEDWIIDPEPLIPADNQDTMDGYRMVSWLEFIRPVQNISLYFCHDNDTRPDRRRTRSDSGMTSPEFFANIALAGLRVIYADGTSSKVGVSSILDVPKDQQTCYCHLGSIGEHLKTTPHYRSVTLDAQGRSLTLMRIWGTTLLLGLQLCFGEGLESPLYGCCDGEPQQLIAFGQQNSEGLVVGVKLFMGKMNIAVTRTDNVIQGFRPLYRRL